jgi:hypothetical protein
MTEYPVPDCLVLKMEAFIQETEWQNTRTSVYFLYDKKYHNYVIRGRRTQSHNDFSFVCEDLHDLVYFVSFIIPKDSLITYTLLNYDRLFIETDNITYDFLLNNEYSENNLANYENEKYSVKRLKNNLRMLRNVFNYYK